MVNDYFNLNKNCFNKFSNKKIFLENGMHRLITIDGPISREYNQAKLRILWVLKEANNDEVKEDTESNERSLIEYILKDIVKIEKPTYPKWYATYSLIIKTSHGILCDNFKTQAFTSHPLHYKKCLESIAIINLNKFGGGEKESSHYHIGISECSELVLSQLAILHPHIVILAGTGTHFNKQPPGVSFPERFYPSIDSFPWIRDKKKGTIYISAYHTNQRTITHEQYYKYIIQAIKGY